MNCFIFRSVDKFYHERHSIAGPIPFCSVCLSHKSDKVNSDYDAVNCYNVVPHNAGWICENVMMHELNE